MSNSELIQCMLNATDPARRQKRLRALRYWRTMALVMWAVWVVTLIGIAAAVTLR